MMSVMVEIRKSESLKIMFLLGASGFQTDVSASVVEMGEDTVVVTGAIPAEKLQEIKQIDGVINVYSNPIIEPIAP